jgi:hypothetical protein
MAMTEVTWFRGRPLTACCPVCRQTAFIEGSVLAGYRLTAHYSGRRDGRGTESEYCFGVGFPVSVPVRAFDPVATKDWHLAATR